MRTPFYLIDTEQLLKNLRVIDYIRLTSGAKCLLALKCFSAWGVFEIMSPYMDGTTSSSLYEARLGHERFGGETHAYSVAFCDNEIEEVLSYADKIIFNSVSQFNRYEQISRSTSRGLRINPNISCSEYLLADPCRPYSRLGEQQMASIESVISKLSGFMFHIHCDNNNYARYDEVLTIIEEKFGSFLHQLEWVSLGGGVTFTDPNYPIDKFCLRLKNLALQYNIQIYLEPGQAALSEAGSFEVSVIDIIKNKKNIAVVDGSTQAHMIDLLIYNLQAKIHPNTGEHVWLIAGNSCLAGDIFGEFRFPKAPQIGDRISFKDAIAYSIVNRNWFNGLRMPGMVIMKPDGHKTPLKIFDYDDFLTSQS